MYIEAGTQTREIGIDYDASHRMTQTREKSVDPAQNLDVYSLRNIYYSPNKSVDIDSSVYMMPFSSVFLIRRTTDSLDGRVISISGEISNNNIWKETQRDTFIYDANNRLIETSTQSWDFVEMVWKTQFFVWYEYNSEGLLSKRRDLSLGNSILDTTAYNEYHYLYNASGRIESSVWKNGSPLRNIDKEIYVYDGNENLDSLKICDWNNVLEIWKPKVIYALDDSPEQQTTRVGKRFRINNLSQWYLYSDAQYIPGPQIYTNQPTEVLIKVFDPNTNQLENYERKRTTYTDLSDGRIEGDHQRAFFTNGTWQNVWHVRAWQRKIESVGVITPEAYQVSSCDLPNPVTIADLPAFLPDNGSAQQLDIYAIDGRLILSQSLSQKNLMDTGMDQTSLHWLVLREKTNIVCAQKVFLR